MIRDSRLFQCMVICIIGIAGMLNGVRIHGTNRRLMKMEAPVEIQQEYITALEVQLAWTQEYLHEILGIEERLSQTLDMIQEALPGPDPQAFQPSGDIPLAPALQEYARAKSAEYGVRYEVVLAVMESESLFNADIRDNVNRDGSRDRGLMQINECNWSWLREEYGLDINDPADNIEAGILLLAMLQEKHGGEELALVAYQCGSGRMAAMGLTTTENSRRVLRRAAEYQEIT